jgi:hypothetical protein
MTVSASDLSTYLGATVDEDRAQLLVDLATNCASRSSARCRTGRMRSCSTWPRAYSNPSNAQTQGAGPFPITYGAVGGGLWLTRQNKATLRRLAGSGGAFTIDTMPATAGTGLPWWDTVQPRHVSGTDPGRRSPDGAARGLPAARLGHCRNRCSGGQRRSVRSGRVSQSVGFPAHGLAGRGRGQAEEGDRLTLNIDYHGLGELLKSLEMQEAMRKKAEQIAGRGGRHRSSRGPGVRPAFGRVQVVLSRRVRGAAQDHGSRLRTGD